eukprot:scaffold10574_cov280-Chaetoceros_neogracile.AAC.6
MMDVKCVRTKDVKVQVRTWYAKHTAPTGYGVLKPREMFFNIITIGPTGIIVEGDDGMHIDGTELHSFVTIPTYKGEQHSFIAN